MCSSDLFRSGELGFLGYVDTDKVAYYRAPEKRHTVRSEFDVRAATALPKVAILYAYAEPENPLLVDALRQAGVQGIVFAGTGAGGISEAEKEAVRRASSGAAPVVFVRSSRVGNGRVIARREYDEMGMIPADNLNPQKARILLMLALIRTRDPQELRRIFSEY